MTRDDFVFAIGFQGDAAIVDSKAKRRHAGMSTMELAEKGLYRAAFCSAIYRGDDAEMQQFIDYFSGVSGMESCSVDRLKRLFGVYTVPDEISRVVAV